MGAIDSLRVTNLDPRDMFGWIYVTEYYTLLHIKYIKWGPHGIREKKVFFKDFPWFKTTTEHKRVSNVW